MRAQRIKTDFHRVGDVALRISIGLALIGVAIWLFAPDSWSSGKTAATVALSALPVGFIIYGATRLLAHFSN